MSLDHNDASMRHCQHTSYEVLGSPSHAWLKTAIATRCPCITFNTQPGGKIKVRWGLKHKTEPFTRRFCCTNSLTLSRFVLKTAAVGSQEAEVTLKEFTTFFFLKVGFQSYYEGVGERAQWLRCLLTQPGGREYGSQSPAQACACASISEGVWQRHRGC